MCENINPMLRYKAFSLTNNAIANYIGQGYIILIGMVITPLYLQYLGAEAYGLVGFFSLMQAWLSLLDLGLSPTLARQVAHARGNKDEFEFFKRLLRSFELIFLCLALTVILIIFFSSDWIAQSWIKSEILDFSTLTYCVILMGVMIGLRWFVSLYRSGIIGMEDQIWLSGVNIVLVSSKFIGALLLLAFITQDIRHFFEYQATISLMEVIILAIRFYIRMPKTNSSISLIYFDWSAVKSIAPFTLGIAYTAGMWILITQADKLILSKMLSLAEFGYFSLVALVAGGITALSSPIAQAIMPRMTMLLAQGRKDEMLVVYRKSSQIITVIASSTALTIGLYSKPLIYAWTGDKVAAEWGSKVLLWFALGNGILAISAFQYYLQNAFGQLRLHVIGSTISAVLQIPLIYFAATKYGAFGAGIAWFSFRAIWFLWWTPVVHSRFIPGFHLNWLLKDIFPIITTAVVFSLIINYLDLLILQETRFILSIKIVGLGLLLLTVTSLSSQLIRTFFIKKYRDNYRHA